MSALFGAGPLEQLHPAREGSGGTARVPAPSRPATRLCRESKNRSSVVGTGCAPAARGSAKSAISRVKQKLLDGEDA